MSDSDSEAADTGPSPSAPPSSSTLVPPKDTALGRILRKHQDRRDRQQAARKEANAARTDAFDKKDKKAKAVKGNGATASSFPGKSPGSILFFLEGPQAFNNTPVPPKMHVEDLKEQGFCAVGVKADDLKIRRDWTYDQTAEFLAQHLPIAIGAASAAASAWKDQHPDDDEPPLFRVLSREGKKLTATRKLRPNGLDAQEAITSASNWYERKLYLTAGVDASLFTEDETSVYRPCALQEELDGGGYESEGTAETTSQIDEGQDSDSEYVGPVVQGKRKRVDDAPVTRAAKRQMRETSHISISDNDEPSTSAKAGQSTSKVAHSTYAVTGFASPPKRNRTRPAQSAP